MSIQKNIDLSELPMKEVAKWRRIHNLIRKLKDLTPIEKAIREGDEESIRTHSRVASETRADLLVEAKKLHVKNYGRLTKGELIDAISDYKENKVVRQRFER